MLSPSERTQPPPGAANLRLRQTACQTNIKIPQISTTPPPFPPRRARLALEELSVWSKSRVSGEPPIYPRREREKYKNQHVIALYWSLAHSLLLSVSDLVSNGIPFPNILPWIPCQTWLIAITRNRKRGENHVWFINCNWNNIETNSSRFLLFFDIEVITCVWDVIGVSRLVCVESKQRALLSERSDQISDAQIEWRKRFFMQMERHLLYDVA